MNHRKSLLQVITLTLATLLLVECGAPQLASTSTPIALAATPTPVPSTPTPTPVPPTSTPTPTPAPPTATPTPTTSPLEARVGEWSGTTRFGSFTFVVSPNGKGITSLELSYGVGIVTGSVSMTPEGEGMAIDEDGSFDLSVPDAQLIFRGQFSQDGTSATGLWEMNPPFMDTLSEEWGIER